MSYLALCTDYDGTLAHHGRVDEPTMTALQRWRAGGRKLLLVTGREIGDLKTVFDDFELFDSIVAENGALIWRPATGEERLLGSPPPPEFVAAVRERRLARLSIGRIIVATVEPDDQVVAQILRDQGLDLQVIMNKGSVMLLPPGVNKATGLTAALEELNVSLRDVVGVGDAENDLSFLTICGYSAAVENALPSVKEAVNYVTKAGHGAGVAELVEMLLREDSEPELE